MTYVRHTVDRKIIVDTANEFLSLEQDEEKREVLINYVKAILIKGRSHANFSTKGDLGGVGIKKIWFL